MVQRFDAVPRLDLKKWKVNDESRIVTVTNIAKKEKHGEGKG